MRSYEELKKVYDNKSVKTIEKEAMNHYGKSHSFYEKFIESLRYLQRSGRYTDNPKYKKSRFRDYLRYEFGMALNTYYSHYNAYRKYPKITTRHSPHMVATVQKVCGPKADKALQAITTQEEKLKRPIQKDEIQNIVNQYRKPLKSVPPKPDVTALKRQASEYQAQAREMEKESLTKDEQIAKLKKALKNRDATLALKDKTIEEKDKRIAKLEAQIDELVSQLSTIADQFSKPSEQRVAVQ